MKKLLAYTFRHFANAVGRLGFRSPVKEMKVLKGIQAVIDYCNAYEEQRDKLPYEIDGMVIKVNDLDSAG